MSRARTKQRPAYAVATAAAALETWGLPAAAGAVALVATVAAAFEIVPVAFGLAIAILGLLALVAERGLSKASGAEGLGPGLAVAIGVVWMSVCYAPFHALLFPGEPLHEPISIHGADASLPVSIPTAGRGAVDLMLEGTLPANPAGGVAAPVQYAVSIEDAASTTRTLTGRFDESLRTQRLGRRGTTTIVQPHHTERRLLTNPADGDITITAASLEPAAGASMMVTAYPHRLPLTPMLIVLALLFLAAVVTLDTRFVRPADGTLTLATPAVLGASLALWTSNTVHPTVSNLIGSLIFGGPLGLVVGALVWGIARRTLVDDRR